MESRLDGAVISGGEGAGPETRMEGLTPLRYLRYIVVGVYIHYEK